MILLPPIIWLIVWAVIAVVACALLGLPPGAKMLETAAVIFLGGGVLLPLASWLLFKIVHHKRVQD